MKVTDIKMYISTLSIFNKQTGILKMKIKSK